MAIDALQAKATRTLEKKLDKSIDGLGFGKKGSQAMKDRMAKIRAMKKSKSASGGSFKAPSGGSFRAPGSKGSGLVSDVGSIRGASGPTPQIQNSRYFNRRKGVVNGTGFLQ